MPVEVWFPTVVFYEHVALEPELRTRLLEAVAERAGPEALREEAGVTAINTPNDFHLEPRVEALFACLRPALAHFLFELMRIDPARTEFHVGRCWPVVPGAVGGGGGGTHFHRGACFSGVYFVEAPAGSGGLEFESPLDWSHDGLAKTGPCDLTHRNVIYPAVEGRLIVFPSALRHRRLPGESGPGERIAIAFDLYTTAALDVPGAGMPRLEHLRRVV